MCDSTQSLVGFSQPSSATATNSSMVVEFRLRNGFCHACGTRIYKVEEGGLFSPLTIDGIVEFGRCLFCYPEARPQTYVSTKRVSECECNSTSRRRTLPPHNEIQNSNTKMSSIQPEEVLSSSVATRPSSPWPFDRRSDEADCGGKKRRETSSSKARSKKKKCDDGASDEVGMQVEIRDYQRTLYVGTLLEGTRRKGRGIFQHLYDDGEHRGKKAEYTGDFQHGRMHGKGTSRDASGCVYEGTFCRGAAHGHGVCTWSDEWRYEGDWVMDRREGQGTIRQLKQNGEIYTGEWKQDQWHGKGNLKFAGGGRYVGDFKDHKLDGYGKYEFADGSIYEGYFKNDMRSGLGTMVYDDGLKYVGEWKNNWREGKGTLFHTDGTVFKGTFANDEKVSGVLQLEDGIMRRQRYVNGVLQD